MAAEVVAVPDLQHLHHPDSFPAAYRDHVDVAPRAVDVLAFLDPAQARDLVPVAGRELEVETPRRGFHALDQLIDHGLAPAFEEHGRMPDVVGVVGPVDEPHARSAAAIDLILEAGPGTVAEERIRALPDAEQLVDEGDGLAHGPGVRVGTEVPDARAPRSAVKDEAGKGRLLREMDPRIALVVAQDDVVARPVLLDQVVLEEQRFGLGMGDGHFHRGGARQESPPLLVPRTTPQPGGEAPSEVARLADVEDPLVAVDHPVDASPARHRLEKGAGVETGRRVVEHDKRILATAPRKVVRTPPGGRCRPRAPETEPGSGPLGRARPAPAAARPPPILGAGPLPAPGRAAPLSRGSRALPGGAESRATRAAHPS